MEVDIKTEMEINKLYSSKDNSYLVFSIHSNRFAYKSSNIQEIMYDAKIHKIPFAPEYIEGVLNCRGTPYTVVNTLKMNNEENAEIQEKIFLLFKRDDDQFCIHLSNIDVFFEVEEDDVLEDGVKYKQKLIPLFNSDSVEERLCKDLGKDD